MQQKCAPPAADNFFGIALEFADRNFFQFLKIQIPKIFGKPSIWHFIVYTVIKLVVGLTYNGVKKMKKNSAYADAGFESRAAYLKSLTDEYPAQIVYLLADLFGPSEDFDGLINELEDYEAIDA